MTDEKLRQAMQVCTSGVTFSRARQNAVLRAARGAQEPIMKRKISMSMALAIVLALLMTSGAVAAGLGVFGQFADRENAGAPIDELNRLEAVATVYDIQVTPEAKATAKPAEETQTDYDRLQAVLDNQPYTLTLNQAYCDGRRLSYSYTLELQEEHIFRGEGKPTGPFNAAEPMDGVTYEELYQGDDEIAKWLNSHDVSWIAMLSAGMGDGADMDDATYLMPIEGESVQVSPRITTGFYTVEIPEDVTVTDAITFSIDVSAHIKLFAQTADGLYDCLLPSRRDSYAFTVPVSSGVMLHGEGQFEAYSATAELTLSDVTLTGAVLLDVPQEWKEGHYIYNGDDESPALDFIWEYVLVVDGEERANHNGYMSITENGQVELGVQSDVPSANAALALRPVYSQSGAHPEEDIPLTQNK